MAKLSTKARKKLPKGKFALPKSRRFPINDKAHARAAIILRGRASKAGSITKKQSADIKRKAEKVLGRKTGTKRKRATRRVLRRK